MTIEKDFQRILREERMKEKDKELIMSLEPNEREFVAELMMMLLGAVMFFRIKPMRMLDVVQKLVDNMRESYKECNKQG